MTTVVCWNMQFKGESWRRLVEMGADVALLQEPCTVPPEVADRVDIGPPDADAWDSCLWKSPRHHRRWPKVAKLSDRVSVKWFKPALPIDAMSDDSLNVSDVQIIAAAEVTPTDGDSKPFIVASMYAAWRWPHPSTGSDDAHTDASAHRIISDLTHFVANADRKSHRILAAGDLNMDYGMDYGWRERGKHRLWYARARTVWEPHGGARFRVHGATVSERTASGPHSRAPTCGYEERRDVPLYPELSCRCASAVRSRVRLARVPRDHRDTRHEWNRRMGTERSLPAADHRGDVMPPAIMVGTGSCGLHFHCHSEVLQTPEEALGNAVLVAVGQVLAAEVVVIPLVAEHEVSGGQHGGGDRHNGLLWAAPAFEASKLRLQIAPVLLGRGPRGLHPRRLQPRRRVTDPGRAALPGTLVEARAQARPRDQMARTGKPRHVPANLGK